MVDLTNGIQGMLPKVSTAGFLNTVLIIIVSVLVLGALGFWIWKIRQNKKYGQFKVVIWEKDSTGNSHEYYDRAGIFLDKKTGFKLFFLQKLKKGLNPNNVPYVTSKDKKGRLVKTVYLRRIGVSNFVYCHVKINDGVTFTVGEEDANWLEQEMEKIRRTFGKEPLWTKLASYIMFIITVLVVMIVLISLFNKFTVLEKVAASMERVTENQLEITQLMYNLTQSPVLNKGMPIIVAGGK